MDCRTTERWPELPYEEWKDTLVTLHMWTQIVDKVRLVQMPWINHSRHTTLYIRPCGLTTSAMPHGLFAVDLRGGRRRRLGPRSARAEISMRTESLRRVAPTTAHFD